MSDMGLEQPVADSEEQNREVLGEDADPGENDLAHELPLEADEADAAEQERALDNDDDDYR